MQGGEDWHFYPVLATLVSPVQNIFFLTVLYSIFQFYQSPSSWWASYRTAPYLELWFF
jgi:hypothetical protein